MIPVYYVEEDRALRRPQFGYWKQIRCKILQDGPQPDKKIQQVDVKNSQFKMRRNVGGVLPMFPCDIQYRHP